MILNRRTLLACIIAIIGLMAGAACAVENSGNERKGKLERQQQIDELDKRPTIDVAVEQHEEMSKSIRDTMTSELHIPEWINDNGSGYYGCNEFGELNENTARKQELDRWYSPGSLSEKQWPKSVEILTRIAANYGFTKIVTTKDTPGDHVVTILDGKNGEIYFASAKNTVLSITTGCHLVSKKPTGSESEVATG
jgi:hypothetical protein